MCLGGVALLGGPAVPQMLDGFACCFRWNPLGLQSSLEGYNASKLTNDSFFTYPGVKGTGHRGPLRFALIPMNSAPGLARHSVVAKLGTICLCTFTRPPSLPTET